MVIGSSPSGREGANSLAADSRLRLLQGEARELIAVLEKDPLTYLEGLSYHPTHCQRRGLAHHTVNPTDSEPGRLSDQCAHGHLEPDS